MKNDKIVLELIEKQANVIKEGMELLVRLGMGEPPPPNRRFGRRLRLKWWFKNKQNRKTLHN